MQLPVLKKGASQQNTQIKDKLTSKDQRQSVKTYDDHRNFNNNSEGIRSRKQTQVIIEKDEDEDDQSKIFQNNLGSGIQNGIQIQAQQEDVVTRTSTGGRAKLLKSKQEEDKTNPKKPIASDIAMGLIQAQGHPVFHLAFFIGIYLIDKSEVEYLCEEVHGQIDGVGGNKLQLNSTLLWLQYFHLVCFLFCSSAYYIQHTDVNNFSSVMLNVISVVFYTYIILQAMERTQVVQEQVNQFILLKDEVSGEKLYDCGSYNFGDSMQWLVLEIIAYFANFIVVVFVLTIYSLPIIGEDMLKQKEIADHIYQDIELINEAKKKIIRQEREEQKQKRIKELENKNKEKSNNLKVEPGTNVVSQQLSDRSRVHHQRSPSPFSQSSAYINQGLDVSQAQREGNEEIMGLEDNEFKETLEQIEKYDYPEFEIWYRKDTENPTKEQRQTLIREKWLKQYREYEDMVKTVFRNSDKSQRMHLMRTFYSDDKFKLNKSVIPKTMIKDEINAVYSNQDLLLQLDDGYSFNNIAITQLIICISSVFMSTVQKYQRVECDIGQEERAEVRKNSDQMKVMVGLIAFHLCQYASFSYLITKIPITYWVLNISVIGLFIWGVVESGDVTCEPFLSNYITLDIIISGLAFIDFLIESYMEEVKRKMIGYNCLQRYHDEVQTTFQDKLFPEIKAKYLDAQEDGVENQVDNLDMSANQSSQLDGSMLLFDKEKKALLNQIMTEKQKIFYHVKLGKTLKDMQADLHDETEKLLLQQDIYSLTFLQFIQSDDPFQHRDLMLKCFVTFILQLALSSLIMMAPTENGGKLKPFFGDYSEKFPTGNTTLNASRFLCTLLLHMSIMPEIRTSISMLRFSVNVAPIHNQDYHSINFQYQFWIAIFKFIGGFYTEYINLYKMCTACSVDNVVKDFIAFNVIVELDDIMVSMLSVNLQESITQQQVEYKTNCDKKFKPTEFQAISNSLYKILKVFYEVVYFYFFPMIVIVMCYNLGDGVTNQKLFCVDD